ncbi:cellulose binding domain-containing protein [Actinomadura monticuli]|uniref:Cellulose binding domain-containing protein n=1 Tax=Actinomadura monticuli TaxID=3097367 RepID=A0ABV4QCY3_9ACTN
MGCLRGAGVGDAQCPPTAPHPASRESPASGGRPGSRIWGAEVTQDGAAVTASNESWNGAPAPGATTTFGFIGTGSAETVTPACDGD